MHDYAKDGGEKLLPRCIAFALGILDDSTGIRLKNAMHLGKRFLTAIFSVIVNCDHSYSVRCLLFQANN